MLGELTSDEIDHLLHLEVVGRIGCHAAGRTYIVPITYAYDGQAIFAYSYDGMKLRMMRQNPSVCFEIEHFDTLANWKSVVIQGRFEELHGEEATAGRTLLVNRFRSLGTPWLRTPPRAHRGGWMRTHHFETPPEEMPVVYRIVPIERSSRFERV